MVLSIRAPSQQQRNGGTGKTANKLKGFVGSSIPLAVVLLVGLVIVLGHVIVLASQMCPNSDFLRSGMSLSTITTTTITTAAAKRSTPKSFLKPCPEDIGSNPPDPRLFASQSNEDKELLQLFHSAHPLCNGTYLEMGAVDGVRYSNSHVFHHAYNWKGVLVEASPRNYPQLVKNRPNEIATVHAGVCSKETILHWVEGNGRAVGGFQEIAPPSFQKRWWDETAIKNAAAVMCQPLRKVLDKALGNGDVDGSKFHFDFFSLDVEGAEFDVLLSNDFERFTFGIVFVESDQHNTMKNMAVRTLLENNGYTFLRDYQRSSWFINKKWGTIYQDILH